MDSIIKNIIKDVIANTIILFENKIIKAKNKGNKEWINVIRIDCILLKIIIYILYYDFYFILQLRSNLKHDITIKNAQIKHKKQSFWCCVIFLLIIDSIIGLEKLLTSLLYSSLAVNQFKGHPSKYIQIII